MASNMCICVSFFLIVVIVQVRARFFYNESTSNFDLEEGMGQNFNENGIPYSPSERARRKSKLFPLFTIIRFTNEPCTGTDPLLDRGICYTRSQCSANNGVNIGSCAQGLGVCCQFYASCGNVITQNNTLFRNPDYPNKYKPTTIGDICQVRVRKQINVCQLRLNFIRFDIEGPMGPPGGTVLVVNDGGQCKIDALTITSSGSATPNICGNMNNQHIYLEYGSSDTLTLNIMLSSNSQKDREWNIEILMIPCRSETRAPTGCLQYFTGVSGQVQSFNFGGGIHLANLDYSSCVRMEDGMRSIEWSACNPGDVKLAGQTVVPPVAATVFIECPIGNLLDYLIIPGGLAFPLLPGAPIGTVTTALTYSTTDRYCDAHFNFANQVVRSVVRPFLIHTRTDNTEQTNIPATTPDASVGFCLRWQQSPQGLN